MSSLGSSFRSSGISFSQQKSARMQELSQIANDYSAQQVSLRSDLQSKYQSLLLEVNNIQSEMASNERDYTIEKERLVTELSRLSIEHQLKMEEAKMTHANRMEQIHHQQSATIHQVAIQCNKRPVSQQQIYVESDILKESKTKLKELEASVREFKKGMDSQEDDDDDHMGDIDSLMETTVRELETQRNELIEEAREKQEEKKAQLMEMTVLLDDLAVSNHEELLQTQQELTEREAQYHKDVEDIINKINRLQVQRNNLESSGRERAARIRQEIYEMETEFREKMRRASKVGEKLKAALVNLNIRKAKELELEKSRLAAHSQLIQQNCELKQKICRAQRELNSAKDNWTVVRRELAQSIGPRRTASLFM